MEPVYGLITTEAVPVPLKGVKVEGDILGRGARVRVSQRFANEEKQPVEAVYKFPLPEGAAICAFTARIDGREITGEIEKREKAFEIYDKALEEGHGAYLLDEERPNIFTLSVGNLKPATEALIEIEYVTTLDTEGARSRFFLPTTISPRYVPADMPDSEGIPVDDHVNPEYTDEVPFGLSVSLRVHDRAPIESIESPTHSIKVNMSEEPVVVTTSADSVRMDRDFILYVGYKDLVTASRAYRVKAGDETFVQLDLVLDKPAGDRKTGARGRDIVFMLDCSGSMTGDSMAQARKALEICLKSLDKGTRFNIYRFGSTFEYLFDRPVEYSKKNLNAALKCLKHTDADLGGTEIAAPLEHLYGATDPRTERKQSIVVITDGEVANEDEVFGLIQANRSGTRAFAIGIGAGCNEFLIKGIARAGGGASEFIYPGERIEPKALGLFAKLIEDGAEDIKISWGARQVEAYPEEPVVFFGTPQTVFARLGASKRDVAGLKVKGKHNGTAVEWNVDITDIDSSAISIPTLWAREAIRSLEGADCGPARRGSRQTARKARLVQDRIVDISRAYGVVSRFTSYVGVEKRKKKDRARGELALRKVPALVSVGWHGYGSLGVPGLDTLVALSGYVSRVSAGQMRQDMLMAPGEGELAAPVQIDRPKLIRELKRQRKQAIARAGEEKTTDILMDILSRQEAEGGLRLNAKLARALGIKITDIRKIAGEMDVEGQVDRFLLVSTALLLATLSEHYTAEMGVWNKTLHKTLVWFDEVKKRNRPSVGNVHIWKWAIKYVRKNVKIKF
jgi:Ca-activated chloride channel family protein